ncbi:MAG: hypothetical protein AAF614_31310, partial [Chloroflexota bacterium]
AYSTGPNFSNNSFNELLSATSDGYTLSLKSLGLASMQSTENMAPQEAAENLWKMFIQPLL